MNIDYSNMAALVSIYNTASLEDKDVVEFAIAATIARRCVARSEDYLEEMSNVSDDALLSHYSKKHRNRNSTMIAEINREIVVDVEKVEELTEKLFVYMANIFAGCFAKTIVCTRPAGPGDIFNMGHYVDKDLLAKVHDKIHVYNKTSLAMTAAISSKPGDEG